MRDFVDELGVDGIVHVADVDGTIWQSFGIYGQPAWVFVDDDGRVDAYLGGLGVDGLTQAVEALIAA